MAERGLTWTRSLLVLFSVIAAAVSGLLAFSFFPSPATVSRPLQPSPPPPLPAQLMPTVPRPDPPPGRSHTLRIGSLNIRYDYDSRHPVLSLGAKVVGGLSSTARRGDHGRYGESRWAERREALMDQVRWEELDVLACQEVLWNQLQDLRELLGENEWGFVGVGRDDGQRKGEAVPIFYRRSRLDLVSVTHRWLSPTPDQPGSKGWDAGQPRMVTIARFSDRVAGGDLVVANTHWDDRGLQARTESAKLILRLVEAELDSGRAAQAEAGAGPDPLVCLCGDLNSPAEEPGYQVLTGGRYPVLRGEEGSDDHAARPGEAAAARASFFDARHELVRRGSALAGPDALSSRFGPLNTFTGFQPSDVPKVIDFVLPFANAAFLPASASDPAAPDLDGQRVWKVARYGVLPNFYEDLGGRRPEGEEGDRDAMVRSDHRLVVARFEQVGGRK